VPGLPGLPAITCCHEQPSSPALPAERLDGFQPDTSLTLAAAPTPAVFSGTLQTKQHLSFLQYAPHFIPAAAPLNTKLCIL
jgi:hypothetical protein